MKSFHYFNFVPSDWMMGRIQRRSYQAQAEFIRLCCIYWNKEGDISLEDAELESECLNELIDFKIIRVDNDKIFIKFLDEQIENITGIRKIRSEAGKLGASAKQRQASAKQVLSKTKHSIREDKKEEDKIIKDIIIKENFPPKFEDVISYFIEKNKPLEAQKFFDFYESNGWKVGKNKMKSWKAASSGWISRMNNFNKNQKTDGQRQITELAKTIDESEFRS